MKIEEVVTLKKVAAEKKEGCEKKEACETTEECEKKEECETTETFEKKKEEGGVVLLHAITLVASLTINHHFHQRQAVALVSDLHLLFSQCPLKRREKRLQRHILRMRNMSKDKGDDHHLHQEEISHRESLAPP